MSVPGSDPTAPPGWRDGGLDLSDAEADALWQGSGHATYVLEQRIRATPTLWVGAGLLTFFVLSAIAAMLAFGDHLTVVALNPTLGEMLPPPGPSRAHPFGVMGGTGTDILGSILQATPVDLALVGGILLLAIVAGVLLGAYAGFDAGWLDDLITGIGDLLAAVPPFFLVLVLFLGIQRSVPADEGLLAFGLLFAMVLWPYYARPVRARAHQVSQSAYIEAARAAGARSPRLLLRHVIPNSFFPVLAQVPVDVYNIFFVLTVFPFLGCFGAGANQFFTTLTPLPSTSTYPEWGNLLASGACAVGGGWVSPALNFYWMYTFPALAILLFGVGVALTCDGVEKVLRVGRVA